MKNYIDALKKTFEFFLEQFGKKTVSISAVVTLMVIALLVGYIITRPETFTQNKVVAVNGADQQCVATYVENKGGEENERYKISSIYCEIQ